MNLPERITVVEVGPRDGFQMEKTFLPTELKVRTLETLSAAGLPEIEATSFVHPAKIPQMADAAAVLAQTQRRAGTLLTVLVPNRRGAERALAANIDGLRLVVCCTETYNQRNVGLSVDESMAQLEEIAALATAVGVPTEIALGAACGCPFEGEVPVKRVLDLARRAARIPVRRIAIADSAGLGHPRQIENLVKRCQDAVPTTELALHLHDTRGLGLANALAGMMAGITVLDSSLGGLGGCPVMPGATGNIATEDLINLCHEMGIATGVDLDLVRTASRAVQTFLGRKLESHVLAAGTRAELRRDIGRK